MESRSREVKILAQRRLAILEVSKIITIKLQITNNDRNSKIQTMPRPRRFWSLNIGI
jgi:hypothetical protein